MTDAPSYRLRAVQVGTKHRVDLLSCDTGRVVFGVDMKSLTMDAKQWCELCVEAVNAIAAAEEDHAE